MPVYAPLQFLSAAITAALYLLFPISTHWYALVFSLGFGHYLLALVYSRRQIKQIATTPHALAPLAMIIAMGTFLYLKQFPLYIYFGVHHVFNEVYLRRRSLIPDDAPTANRFTAAAVILHFVAYFLLLRARPIADSGYLPLVLTILVLAAAGYGYGLMRLRSALTRAQVVDLCAFELTVLALVPVAFHYPFTLEQIVCYHFLFWMLYPLHRFRSRGRGAGVAPYVLMTAASVALFLLVSPLGPAAYQIPVRVFMEQFVLWSYVHITISFAVSTSHPDWIVRWFQPRIAAPRAMT